MVSWSGRKWGKDFIRVRVIRAAVDQEQKGLKWADGRGRKRRKGEERAGASEREKLRKEERRGVGCTGD